jgi:sigma-E factor negative regulatory protein RseC
MIEEQGRVVAREPGAIWVETVRASACAACRARQGCGHSLLNRRAGGERARLKIATEQNFDTDDTVVIGVPERALLHGALWVYGMPLALLFAGALLGDALRLPFDGAAVFGITGLVIGFVLNRWRDARGAGAGDKPVVLSEGRAGRGGAAEPPSR